MKLSILTIAAALVLTAACNSPARTPAPPPHPTPGTMPETRTGGPCGDGTVLRPGEHCP